LVGVAGFSILIQQISRIASEREAEQKSP